ncbi:MAG: LOG family protein [Chloroflexota bacterium]
MKRITVFGGSRPTHEHYDQALRLGQLLGQAGYTVLTGGYIGTMEAVSRGAAESGGHVIGVTCDEIEAWRPVRPNAYVQEELRYPTLRLRLNALIDECDAALALPGGPGTLAEIAMMWSHLLTGAITPRPLILIGPGWRQTFEQFYHSLGEYTPSEQRRWLAFASDVDQAVDALVEHNGWGEFP